jgi:hypothetical protein
MKLAQFSFKAGRLHLNLAESDFHDIERLLTEETGGTPDKDSRDEVRLKALALQLYSARVLRAKYLPQTMFGEAAWDMMLALYAFPDEVAGLDSLCENSRQSVNSTLRWIDYLEEQGLLAREQWPHGPMVQLTDAGRGALESYLAHLSGTPPTQP